MAKKIATDKGQPKVIAKCDNLNEVAQNHDEVITSVVQSSPESVSIKSMIRLIRGQQVMLDSDLAFLYGVETRRLNEQVKRNIERFPDDFMFQLTKEEFDFLKSQFAMSNITDSQGNKNLKITSQAEFDKQFSAAAFMGEKGKVTKIDFSKEFVIAKVLPVTDKETILKPIRLVENGKDKLQLFYSLKEGKQQSYFTQPMFILIVGNKYKSYSIQEVAK